MRRKRVIAMQRGYRMNMAGNGARTSEPFGWYETLMLSPPRWSHRDAHHASLVLQPLLRAFITYHYLPQSA